VLKVFLHNGPLDTVSPFNLLGRLDIGYENLDIHADYKAILTMSTAGELPPVRLLGYPRWTASVWDLVMRTIALALHGEEAFPALDFVRRGAFAQQLTAIVQHWPDGEEQGRSTVGTAQIRMLRKRCRYVATFEDDILGTQTSTEFTHTPDVLVPWDLVARAYAWAGHGRASLPPRPSLYMPIPFEQDGQVVVALDTVKEPARTGLHRWMLNKGVAAVGATAFSCPCIKEADYVRFLQKAI